VAKKIGEPDIDLNQPLGPPLPTDQLEAPLETMPLDRRPEWAIATPRSDKKSEENVSPQPGSGADATGSAAPVGIPPGAVADYDGNADLSSSSAASPRSPSLNLDRSRPQVPAPLKELTDDVAYLKKMGWEISPAEMLKVYPGGGRIPKEFLSFSNEVRRVHGKETLDALLKRPDSLRALTESTSVRFVPGPDGVKLRSKESGEGMTASEYVQNVLAPTGKEAVLEAWLSVAEMVKPLFPRPELRNGFYTSVGEVVDPGTGNKRVFVTMTHPDDPNGAMRKDSIRGSDVGLTRIPYTELPFESLGKNPLILDVHGSPFAAGPSNQSTARALAAEIIRQKQAGTDIDRVVCASCSQRDPRKFGLTGESNGHALQKMLDENLDAAGLPSVPIFTADKAGLLYKPDSFSNMMVGTKKTGPTQSTNLAPVQPPTRAETLSAIRNTGLAISGFALTAFASAAGGRALMDRLKQLPLREPTVTTITDRAEEQRILRNDLDRLKQLDLNLTQGETPKIRTEARDELVNFARTLPEIAASNSGRPGAESAASKRMVDALVTDMANRYGLDPAQFIGPGGNLDAFPDALAEKLDAGR
jgi:hypothetical protein